jgi:hypothetical protein
MTPNTTRVTPSRRPSNPSQPAATIPHRQHGHSGSRHPPVAKRPTRTPPTPGRTQWETRSGESATNAPGGHHDEDVRRIKADPWRHHPTRGHTLDTPVLASTMRSNRPPSHTGGGLPRSPNGSQANTTQQQTTNPNETHHNPPPTSTNTHPTPPNQPQDWPLPSDGRRLTSLGPCRPVGRGWGFAWAVSLANGCSGGWYASLGTVEHRRVPWVEVGVGGAGVPAPALVGWRWSPGWWSLVGAVGGRGSQPGRAPIASWGRLPQGGTGAGAGSAAPGAAAVRLVE